MIAGNWGVHVVIPKWPFSDVTDTATPYMPLTVSGSSTLMNETMTTVSAVSTAG